MTIPQKCKYSEEWFMVSMSSRKSPSEELRSRRLMKMEEVAQTFWLLFSVRHHHQRHYHHQRRQQTHHHRHIHQVVRAQASSSLVSSRIQDIRLVYHIQFPQPASVKREPGPLPRCSHKYCLGLNCHCHLIYYQCHRHNS